MKKRTAIVFSVLLLITLYIIISFVLPGKDVSGYYNSIDEARSEIVKFDNGSGSKCYESGTLICTEKLENGYVDFILLNDELYIVTIRNKYIDSIEKYSYMGATKTSNIDYKISENSIQFSKGEAIDFREVDLYFGLDVPEVEIKWAIMKENCTFDVNVSTYNFTYKNNNYILYIIWDGESIK